MHRRRRGAPPIGDCMTFLTGTQQAILLILLLVFTVVHLLFSSAVSDLCWQWPCRSFEKSNHDREASRLVPLPQLAEGSHLPLPFLVVHFAAASFSSARGERYDNESYVVLHLRFVDRKDFIGGNQQSWPFLNRLCRNNKFLTAWRPAVERTVGELESLRVRQNAINVPTTSSLLAVWQKSNEGSVVPTRPSTTTASSITTTISVPTTTNATPVTTTTTTPNSTTAHNQTSGNFSSASFLGVPFEFQGVGKFNVAAAADEEKNITNTTALTSNTSSAADNSTTTAQVETTTQISTTTTTTTLSTTSTMSNSSAASTSTRATTITSATTSPQATTNPPTPTAPSGEASEPIQWDDLYPPYFLKPHAVPHYYSESCTIYNTAHDYYRIFKPLFGQSGKGYPTSQQGTSPSQAPSSTAPTTTAAGLIPTASTTGLPPTIATTSPGPTAAPEPTVSLEVLEELRRSPHIAVRLSSGRQPVLKFRGYAGGHAYESSGAALTTLYAVTLFVRGTKEGRDALVASWSGNGPDVELNKYYSEELGIVSASILGDPAQLWGPIDDPANWPDSDGSSQSNAAMGTGGQASGNEEALIPDVFWSASYATVTDGQGLSIGWVVIIVVGMLLVVSVGTILYHRREGKKGIRAEAVQGLTEKAAKRKSEKSSGSGSRSVGRKHGPARGGGFLELSEEYINTYVFPRFGGGSAMASRPKTAIHVPTGQSAGDLSVGLLSGGDFSDNDDEDSEEEGLLSLKHMEEYEGHLRENNFEGGQHEEEEEVPPSWRVPDLETELAINIVRRQQATKMTKAMARRQQRDEEQRRLLMSHGMEEPILNHNIRRLRRKEEEEKANITASLIQRTLLMPKFAHKPPTPLVFHEDGQHQEEGEDIENPYYTIPNHTTAWDEAHVVDEHGEAENDWDWRAAEGAADMYLAVGEGNEEEEETAYNYQGPQEVGGDGEVYGQEHEQPYMEFNGSHEGEFRSGEWVSGGALLEMHDIPRLCTEVSQGHDPAISQLQHSGRVPYRYMGGRGRRKGEEQEIAHPTGAQWSVQPFLETLSIDESFRLPPLRNADGTIVKRAPRGLGDSNAPPSASRKKKRHSSPRGPWRKKGGEEGIERLDRGKGKAVKRIGEIEFVGGDPEENGGGPLTSLTSAWTDRDMDGLRSSSESSENSAPQRYAYLPPHSHRGTDSGDERDGHKTESLANAARRAMMEELEKDLINSRLGLAARRKMNEIRDVQSQVINTIVLSQKGIVLKPEQYKAFDNTTAFNRLPTSKFAFAASRFPGWNHAEPQNTEANSAAKSAVERSEEISSNSAKNNGDSSASTARPHATAVDSASLSTHSSFATSSNLREEQHDNSVSAPIRKRMTSVPDLIAPLKRAPSFVNQSVRATGHPQPATADPLSPTFSSSSLKSSINGAGRNNYHGANPPKLRSPTSRAESARFGDTQPTAILGSLERPSPLNERDAVRVAHRGPAIDAETEDL